ncbi:MAG: DUF1573 domain-containing protein [Bacteroidales bacterium]|nr:DUF1573 domain-containing protein [Bacteroidales bacterium]
MNTKRFFLALTIAIGLLAACDNTPKEGLPTELVNNPKSASQSHGKEAAISFDKKEHDFGTLLQGEVVTCSFHFTNTGNAPLIISDVKTSCGCTIGDFPREPIAPGKDGNIKATYDSKGHHGFQSRSLTVVANTNPNQTTLQLKGTVKTPDQY